MAERDPTCIGRVRHILGSTVTVALDQDLAGVSPTWRGRLQPIGQVGSLVRIPQGPITLLATVTLVGIAELTRPLQPASVVQVGDRWLQVQLLGEVDGLGRFSRGVSSYPGLDDAVHFATSEDLRAVFPSPNSERVRIGCLSTASEVPVSLDASRLVMRHSAVVGSTGSGKTSAVASLVQAFVKGGWPSANVIVVDPHGEYSPAFSTNALLRSVRGAEPALLRVPFWALPALDILGAFCGSVDSQTVRTRFSDLVTAERRLFASTAAWVGMDSANISADTPIPFNIRRVWKQLHDENTATFSAQGGSGSLCIQQEGDAEQLRPTQFQTYGLGNTAPFKGPYYGVYQGIPERLRLRLGDPRIRFFLEPHGSGGTVDPLPAVVAEWLGQDKPVSVLDFSGVPGEVTDLAIGVVLQLIFELAIHSKTDGIGRPRPVLVVLEEAHRYLGSSATVRLARDSANRIAREGRKYGVGLLLVTQRPAELPDTALAQCGTLIALRLTNSADQSTVKTALPDNISALADSLPALQTGEAIVSGESLALPARVRIDTPSPWPDARDPGVESWREPAHPNDVSGALHRWRHGREA